MENRITAGVVVEHAGTRWRIERPLGADAVLLRNDAGEIRVHEPVHAPISAGHAGPASGPASR
jgi:hypothetical protein